jgi:THO complex subunit 4
MDNALDRSLDEILAERKQVRHRRIDGLGFDGLMVSLQNGSGRGSHGNRGGNRGQRRERQDYPRDGVRKVRATRKDGHDSRS